MNKKLITVAVVYVVIIAIAAGMLLKYNRDRRMDAVADNNDLKVVVNEIEQSIASGDDESAKRLCVELKNSLSKKADESSSDFTFVILPALISVIGVITILFYVDRSVLRPFRKLKNYAADVSKGDLDKPLQVERGNYFGDFTWAFDNMRREIVKSRASEKEAIENNKTVIATLSHDIKTPVASIRAYAEAFEANMDSTPEKRQKYISTLMEKCDEVTKLTNDLFLHSISEMNKLEVKTESVELTGFIRDEVGKLFVGDDEAQIKLPENKEVFVRCDRKRLLQIFENLKNNAEKYAKTPVEITLEADELTGYGLAGDEQASDELTSNEQGYVKIHFRDFGPGISDEEIPFITGKFYRGKNVGSENGSGLGLYIIKELMTKMEGDVSLYNKNPGLDVVLTFKCGTDV